MTYGEAIRARRVALEMSVPDLAALTQVSTSFLYNLEGGHRKEPTFSDGVRIANALRLDPTTLKPVEELEKTA